VRGAFDPVNEIAEICKKYKIWLHVDAAWGGGLIFSQKHRAKLNGIERADSIVINPHKLLAVPQQCSLLLVKDKEILHQCHSKNAEYLFQRDKYYDKSFDLGDKYLQCGRKCDVFKFWFMWKAKVSKLGQKLIKNIYIFLNNFFVSFCRVF
jgi:glutamate/tyrosine decarboxylase-like PLP-dependent enzyme